MTRQTQRTFDRANFYGLVTDLLRGSYGETGVMDLGKLATGKFLACYGIVTGNWRLCRRRLFVASTVNAASKSNSTLSTTTKIRLRLGR